MPAAGFPFGYAISRRLDAVIDRIAHEVNQGIDQPLDDARIDFGMFTGCDQRHFFSRCTRHLTRGPSESSERRTHRHHAGPGDFVPHTEGQLCQVTHVVM